MKLAGFISRLKRNGESGSSAVEFSMLLPLFLSVLFSGFEAGTMYLKIGMVEHGVSEIARQINTGRARGASNEEVIDIFCDAVDTVLTCDGNVTLEVRKLTNYNSVNADAVTCVNTGETLEDDDKPEFRDTNGGEIVYIRVCITTELLLPQLKNLTFSMINAGLKLPETAPGRYRLAGTTVIRNEPF